MKTEEFLSQLLGVTETKVSNHNMNPIGFVHYNKPDQINKPVQQQINSLLVEPATVALLDALREWFEFEATNYTCGGFGCQNDYLLKSKIQAVRKLYPKKK